MSLTFRSYIDGGRPQFTQYDHTYSIIAAPEDKGRWLADYDRPLQWGSSLTLLGQLRTTADLARISLLWWANAPGQKKHSVEHAAELQQHPDAFKQFIYDFIVPQDVKGLRIELRGRSGPGVYEFKDVRIVQRGDPQPVIDPGADKMLTVSLNFGDVRWRVTASRASISAARIENENVKQE